MSDRKKKLVNRILVFCLFLCGILATLLILLQMFKTEEVRVEGLSYYQKEEFLNLISGSQARQNTLLFRLRDHYNHKTDIPYIEDYEVITLGRNVLCIQVYEKILVGCVSVCGEFLYFDKDGLVTESSEKQELPVPLIKGLTFDRILLHEKLVIEKKEIFQQILNLTKLILEYKLPVKNICFSSRGEVELQTENIVIELGKKDSYILQIQKIAEFFPSVSERKLSIDMTDFDGSSTDIIAKPITE